MALSPSPLLPVVRATRFGWIFTEMGRQPWVVFGLMTTANGVSPRRQRRSRRCISLIVLTLLYGVLAVVEVGLMLDVHPPGRRARSPSPPTPAIRGRRTTTSRSTFAY